MVPFLTFVRDKIKNVLTSLLQCKELLVKEQPIIEETSKNIRV
jgi:hypothetical protein